MAFTFTKGTHEAVTLFDLFTATTDAASAAGTFYTGAKPKKIVVYQTTTPERYEWNDSMPAGYMFKTTAAGVMTYEVANGITVAASTSATAGAGPWAITFGTGLHTNNASFLIEVSR